MKHTFYKNELHTGDIIEARNGDRGIVILEKDCIIYQAGGLDELEIFTEDLFVDGPQREGDIFKVYRDYDGPIGFEKLFGLDPVFVRRDNKATRQRANELSAKYDTAKDTISAVVFEPCYRRCENTQILRTGDNIDLAMSEAPSMTVCGQLKTDRTFIPVPQAKGLFVVYNRHQEKWHIENLQRELACGLAKNPEPVITIPEMNLDIYSRCLLVRMSVDGQLENLNENDFGSVKRYLNQMQ